MRVDSQKPFESLNSKHFIYMAAKKYILSFVQKIQEKNPPHKMQKYLFIKFENYNFNVVCNKVQHVFLMFKVGKFVLKHFLLW